MNIENTVGKISFSPVCSANRLSPVGSKVVDHMGFLRALKESIEAFDWSTAAVPGQALIDVPEAINCVSSGVGHQSNLTERYTLREHRGKVSAYLKREYALPVTSCKVVVYSLEAYLADPQVTSERALTVLHSNAYPLAESGQLYVVVAVLAGASDEPARSPYRFVDCLAGGNNEADTWTLEDIREMAKEIIYTEATYSVVAG